MRCKYRMETDTYYKLKDILKKSGESQFGKIIQCLCALAFYKELKCSTKEIDLKLSEGIDIIINKENQRYAIEVKTTSKKEISLQDKDFEAYTKYPQYTPLFCILEINLHSKILLITQKRLARKKTWSIEELDTDDELKDLAERINKKFEELVKKNSEGIKNEGLRYLLEELKKEGIRYSGG